MHNEQYIERGHNGMSSFSKKGEVMADFKKAKIYFAIMLIALFLSGFILGTNVNASTNDETSQAYKEFYNTLTDAEKIKLDNMAIYYKQANYYYSAVSYEGAQLVSVIGSNEPIKITEGYLSETEKVLQIKGLFRFAYWLDNEYPVELSSFNYDNVSSKAYPPEYQWVKEDMGDIVRYTSNDIYYGTTVFFLKQKNPVLVEKIQPQLLTPVTQQMVKIIPMVVLLIVSFLALRKALNFLLTVLQTS